MCENDSLYEKDQLQIGHPSRPTFEQKLLFSNSIISRCAQLSRWWHTWLEPQEKELSNDIWLHIDNWAHQKLLGKNRKKLQILKFAIYQKSLFDPFDVEISHIFIKEGHFKIKFYSQEHILYIVWFLKLGRKLSCQKLPFFWRIASFLPKITIFEAQQ